MKGETEARVRSEIRNGGTEGMKGGNERRKEGRREGRQVRVAEGVIATSRAATLQSLHLVNC